MADLKTKENDGDVIAYLSKVQPDAKREDCMALLDMMREATGEEARMWGSSIVGFGKYHYKYASGREGEWMRTGFAARKQALTLYIMPGFERYEELLGKLGKYSTGKSCLYIKELEDVDQEILRELVQVSAEYMKTRYPLESKE